MTTDCPAADGSSPKRQSFDGPPPSCIDPAKRYTAEMITTKGTIRIALDPIAAPKTVNNFVVLARYHYFDGIDTNGSQFFIISGPQGVRLPPNYSLFGKAVFGLDVVAAIDAIGTKSGTPKERVVIESVSITETD
jgi:cyclophilin family peptidyl-prolyl cis-trans isomerase